MIRYNEPIYQKVGRRYKEVGQQFAFDCFAKGSHLLVVGDGCTSYLRNINTDESRAALLAAMKIASRAMVDAMVEASEVKPCHPPVKVTDEQRALLDKLRETGFNASMWQTDSLFAIVEAGMKALEVGNE